MSIVRVSGLLKRERDISILKFAAIFHFHCISLSGSNPQPGVIFVFKFLLIHFLAPDFFFFEFIDFRPSK